MRSAFKLVLATAVVLTVASDAVGQGGRTVVEAAIGWGKPPGAGTDYYYIGSYWFPEDVVNHRVTRDHQYTSELQWAAGGQVAVLHGLLDWLAGVVYAQLEAGRYEAFKTIYTFPEPPARPGAHRMSSDAAVDATGYVLSGAVGVRLYPFGDGRGPFCEMVAGRRYWHVDLRWQLSPPPGSRFGYRHYVRNRSGDGFGALALGYSLPLTERWLLTGKLQWLPPGSSEYEMLTALVGAAWRL